MRAGLTSVQSDARWDDLRSLWTAAHTAFFRLRAPLGELLKSTAALVQYATPVALWSSVVALVVTVGIQHQVFAAFPRTAQALQAGRAVFGTDSQQVQQQFRPSSWTIRRTNWHCCCRTRAPCR